MLKILALTLVSPDLPPEVLHRFKYARDKVPTIGDNYKITEWIMDDSIEPALPTDKWGPVNKVARLRNNLIAKYLNHDHDLVLWMDSDIVEFPSNILSEGGFLHNYDPTSCILSPVCRIELTKKWYDWGACIQGGTSHIQPEICAQIYGRNVETNPPYFHPAYLRNEANDTYMDMDSVSQCVLIPAEVYRRGAHHEACAFYEFWLVCQKAKEIGIDTFIDRRITIFHADRSLYGRNWGTM